MVTPRIHSSLLLALLVLSACGEPPGEPARGATTAVREADPADGSLVVRGSVLTDPAPVPAFLLDRDGHPVVVTARWRVEDPSAADRAQLALELWEERVLGATARFADVELTLGGPACSGLDHWASDVLMLEVLSPTPGLRALASSPSVPSPGDEVRFGAGSGTVREVFADAFLEIEPFDQEHLPAPGMPVLDGQGRALAVTSELRGPIGARAVAAQLLRPFLGSPPRLDGRSLGTVAPPLVEADLSADGRLLAAGTPPTGRLLVVDLEAREEYLPLGSIDDERRFGLGAFPDEGFSFVAVASGESRMYEVLSGIPLASIDAPAGAPREVATAGRWIALTSSEELVVIDLSDFSVARRLAGAFGPVAIRSGKVLLGAGPRVLEVEPRGDAPPRLVLTLDPDEAGRQRLVTALAADGPQLWIGCQDQLLRFTDVGTPSPPRVLVDTGEGAVNAIGVDGGAIWIGTGSTIQDAQGDLVNADCYVRVIDAADGRELARSHDHSAPVRALFRRGGEWVGVAADGAGWSWRGPH